MRLRRDEWRDPGSLAEPPETNSCGVDVATRSKRCHGARGVGRLGLERNIVAAPVVAKHGDAARRKHGGEMIEQVLVARAISRGMKRDEGRIGPGASGQGQRRAERDTVADGERDLSNGRRDGR